MAVWDLPPKMLTLNINREMCNSKSTKNQKNCKILMGKTAPNQAQGNMKQTLTLYVAGKGDTFYPPTTYFNVAF